MLRHLIELKPDLPGGLERYTKNCDKAQPSVEIRKWLAHLQQQYKVVHRMITRVEVVVGTHFVGWVKLHFLIDAGMP